MSGMDLNVNPTFSNVNNNSQPVEDLNLDRWSNKAEFARLWGKGFTEVTRSIEDGRFRPDSLKSERNRIYIHVRRGLEDMGRIVQENGAKRSPRVENMEERTRLLRAKADLLDLEYEQRRKSVIPMHEVKHGWLELMVTLDQAMLEVPGQMLEQHPDRFTQADADLVERMICRAIEPYLKQAKDEAAEFDKSAASIKER